MNDGILFFSFLIFCLLRLFLSSTGQEIRKRIKYGKVSCHQRFITSFNVESFFVNYIILLVGVSFARCPFMWNSWIEVRHLIFFLLHFCANFPTIRMTVLTWNWDDVDFNFQLYLPANPGQISSLPRKAAPYRWFGSSSIWELSKRFRAHWKRKKAPALCLLTKWPSIRLWSRKFELLLESWISRRWKL